MGNKYHVKRFKDIIEDFNSFKKHVIEPLRKVMVDDKGEHPQWLNGKYSFFNNEYIYELFKNQYNERIPYHKKDEFLGYLRNYYMQFTPQFFVKLTTILENRLADLIDNENRGVKSTVNSRSDRSVSSDPFNNTITDHDMTDNHEQSLYKLDTVDRNVLNNVALVNSAHLNGEVLMYINSFSNLFTSTDINISSLGHNGIEAIVGPKGKTGYRGMDGLDGPPGMDGIDGKDGINGKAGIDGINGKDGKDGINGKPGINGSKGVKGDSGHSVNAKGTLPSKADIFLVINPVLDDAWLARDSQLVWVWNGSRWIEFGKGGALVDQPARDKAKQAMDIIDGLVAPPAGNSWLNKTMDNLDSIGQAVIDAKASKTYVDTELAKKANKSLNNLDTNGEKEIMKIASGNLYQGSFTTEAIKNKFLTTTNVVPQAEFDRQTGLTMVKMNDVTEIKKWGFSHAKLISILLPKIITIRSRAFEDVTTLNHIEFTTVEVIEDNVFKDSPLTFISLKNVKSIDTDAFKSVVNNVSTIVELPSKFNTTTIKNDIFGAGNWDKITFKWFIEPFSYTNDLITNGFGGTFTTPSLFMKFMGITNIVVDNQFKNEDKLTMVSFPNVSTIGEYAFISSPLTTLSIPKATLIGINTFGALGPFLAIVNASTTKVMLPKGNDIHGVAFNSVKYKDYMFGKGNWDKISFTWV